MVYVPRKPNLVIGQVATHTEMADDLDSEQSCGKNHRLEAADAGVHVCDVWTISPQGEQACQKEIDSERRGQGNAEKAFERVGLRIPWNMEGMPAKQSLHFKQRRRGPVSIERDHA